MRRREQNSKLGGDIYVLSVVKVVEEKKDDAKRGYLEVIPPTRRRDQIHRREVYHSKEQREKEEVTWLLVDNEKVKRNIPLKALRIVFKK